jgi:predicted DsbA family dithiol-disulfide isomerase
MERIEVFADIGCPFAHAGLRAVVAHRRALGTVEPRLVVRAWPLELVNDGPHSGHHLAPEIVALRKDVAPDLFAGFDADHFPTTTLPALAAVAAAYRESVEQGEVFSLAVRDALWEHGLDISDPDVLHHLAAQLGVPDATAADEAAVRGDWAEGRERGVTGSPHFFTTGGDFFCPALDISKDDRGFQIAFDNEGFQRFIDNAFR